MSKAEEQKPSVRGSWARLSASMGSHPEMAIFKRFRKLNALRLLEMQSDIMEQQEDWEFLKSIDEKSECPITQSYQISWENLELSEGEGGSQQRNAWRKIKQGLDAYSKVLYE